MKQTSKKSVRRLLCLFTSVVCLSVVDTVAYASQPESIEDLNAGAAIYLEGVVDEVAKSNFAGDGTGSTSQEDEGSDSTDESDRPLSNLVMANVKDSVNVREEADQESQAVGKLYANCGGEILEQSNGWTKIKSGNLEGWTSDEYLVFGEEALALQETAGSLKATITTDALRVRKEASEDAGVYGLVKNGDDVTVVEELDEWVAVQYDDDTVGYVAKDYVTVSYVIPSGKTNQEIADEERAKELAKLSKNRGAIPTSVSDVTLLAALIQCEAGSQPYEGQVAVGAVVMNRVRSGGYPNSIIAVISAPGQFPPATNGKVASVVASGPKASCMQAAQAAVDGATTVGGATKFNRVGSAQGVVIGNHVFW